MSHKVEWHYEGVPLQEIPDGAIGFIYLITFDSGEMYIGKKNFFSTRRVAVKGRVNRKVVTKESDWRIYQSSSEEVKKRIKNKEPHQKLILLFADTKGALTFLEIKEMFHRDVLCNPQYLNKNIFLKIFKCFKSLKVDK